MNEQDLANLGFVRQEETVDLAQRLKRGAINIINAVGVALAVKILMNVDLSQILHIIIKYNIYTLPSPPGMSEENAEFVREDEAEIEELASRLIQEDYPRGTV